MERILILVSLIFSCLSMSEIGNINKPTVPGVDVTKVGNSETLYIYNVEADAFVTYGYIFPYVGKSIICANLIKIS